MGYRVLQSCLKCSERLPYEGSTRAYIAFLWVFHELRFGAARFSFKVFHRETLRRTQKLQCPGLRKPV